jgi:hypothetical protein
VNHHGTSKLEHVRFKQFNASRTRYMADDQVQATVQSEPQTLHLYSNISTTHTDDQSHHDTPQATTSCVIPVIYASSVESQNGHRVTWQGVIVRKSGIYKETIWAASARMLSATNIKTLTHRTTTITANHDRAKWSQSTIGRLHTGRTSSTSRSAMLPPCR